jgi:hypothetical protein
VCLSRSVNVCTAPLQPHAEYAAPQMHVPSDLQAVTFTSVGRLLPCSAPTNPEDPVCTRIFQHSAAGTRSLTFNVLDNNRLPQGTLPQTCATSPLRSNSSLNVRPCVTTVGFDFRTNSALQNFTLANRIRVLLVKYVVAFLFAVRAARLCVSVGPPPFH